MVYQSIRANGFQTAQIDTYLQTLEMALTIPESARPADVTWYGVRINGRGDALNVLAEDVHWLWCNLMGVEYRGEDGKALCIITSNNPNGIRLQGMFINAAKASAGWTSSPSSNTPTLHRMDDLYLRLYNLYAITNRPQLTNCFQKFLLRLWDWVREKRGTDGAHKFIWQQVSPLDNLHIGRVRDSFSVPLAVQLARDLVQSWASLDKVKETLEATLGGENLIEDAIKAHNALKPLGPRIMLPAAEKLKNSVMGRLATFVIQSGYGLSLVR